MKVNTEPCDRADPPTHDVRISSERMAQWCLDGLARDRLVPDGHYPQISIDHMPDGSARVRLWKTDRS